MATTTNYGWSTPDDTALVKDGASAIRSLGSAIDTTVFNNAGAAIAKTIVDAKGDIIAATAADTVSRLASSGVNGDVLQVDTSTATGLKWAAPILGGMTLITSGTLSGSAVDFTSISGYNDLQLVLRDVYASNAFTNFRIRLNASSSAVYDKTIHTLASTSIQNTAGSTQFVCNDDNNAAPGTAQNDFLVAYFPDYANTTTKKMFQVSHTYFSTSQRFYSGWGTFNTTGAITEINLSCAAGNFGGGTYRLYGVK